jgi:hypothetical protein
LPQTSGRSKQTCELTSSIDRRLEAQCGDRADTGYRHEPADLHIMTRQLVNLAVEIADLLLDGLARGKQRSDRSPDTTAGGRRGRNGPITTSRTAINLRDSMEQFVLRGTSTRAFLAA